MALNIPLPPGDRKRVKVYELRNNDWFDRGTGFCTGQIIDDEPRIYVEAEEEPERTLLETKVSKDDGYQKQQETLIVWTEQPQGTDMALSFQEAEGCAAIWDFVSHVQQHLMALAAPDDALSEDALDTLPPNPIMLPPPELGNLPDIEQVVRGASSTPHGRDSLAKFVLAEDYITKLIPLVNIAEDLESLPDLHRMCIIMKTLILLNDTAIMEHVVTDEVILGVVGALEYDPDFPNHKANHRHYLTHRSKFKEVVQIQDETIRKKIHHTYRLQYLKDVVLARILDDPTFSVLNSLIFYNQVDIVQHLQANADFIKELFLVFEPEEQNPKRKKDGVLFIQQCCAISKNIQASARAQLYNHFIQNDVFKVITFALGHQDPSVRIAGTDVLVALIDHDPGLMRSLIFKQISDKVVPLTETLIELLLSEVDFGVKAQMADAIKVLLDPASNNSTVEAFAKASTEMVTRARGTTPGNPQTENFIQHFYEESAKKLFQPLADLERRGSVQNLTPMEVALYSHLVEILNFFVRQHLFRSKFFILANHLAERVGQLVACKEKHLKLTALKFFRTCVGMQDEFYNRQLFQHHLIGPILDVVFETMPRNNLLNSVCLEFFEYIKRENVRALTIHIVETYRDRIKDITYVDTFQNLILKYDQMQQGYNVEGGDQSLLNQEDSTSINRTPINGGRRWQGVGEMDATEEEYFNTSDDEEETTVATGSGGVMSRLENTANGAPVSSNRPLVDYPDDEEENNNDDNIASPLSSSSSPSTTITTTRIILPSQPQQQLHQQTDHRRSQQQQAVITSSPSSSSSSPHLSSSPPTTQQHHQQAEPKTPPLRPQRTTANLASTPRTPPERLSEKRRREEDEADDDELNKLSMTKRRSSSMSSTASSSTNMMGTLNSSGGGGGGGGMGSGGSGMLRRRKSFGGGGGGGGNITTTTTTTNTSSSSSSASASAGGGGGMVAGRRIAISISVKNRDGGSGVAGNNSSSGGGDGSVTVSTGGGGGGGGGMHNSNPQKGTNDPTTTTTTTTTANNNNDDDDAVDYDDDDG